MFFIGIDIGTSNIKALLMDEKKSVRKISITPNQTIKDSYGYAVYSAENIWRGVLYVMRDCITEARGEVAGISIASMTEAGLPLDNEGRPLYGIIPWSDKRTVNVLPGIESILPGYALYGKTGQPLQAKYALTRLVWFQQNLPSVFSSMETWLSVGDYILWRLTGRYLTDYTQATRTMLYNITDNKWDSEILRYFGIVCRLPEVVEMGAEAGPLRRDVSMGLGLEGHTKVYVGGHDHLVALHACGVDEPDIFDSAGTSEVFAGLSKTFATSEESYKSGIALGLYGADQYYWMTSLPSSGATLEWLRKIFGAGSPVTYRDIIEMTSRDMETDIQYLPYINGSGTPYVDSSAKGSFINISAGDGNGQLCKAAYEGIAFQTRVILETLERLGICNPRYINVCGGGGKNPVWQSVKSDALQKTVRIYDVQEMSAYGAALLAAGDFHENSVYACCQIEPEIGRKEYYDRKYAQFISLAEQLRRI